MIHLPFAQHNLRKPEADSGFTLLELLVALAIFAILAVSAYTSLDMLLKTSSRMDAEGARLRELQNALRWLERDLDQAVDRPIRSAYEEELPPLSWPGTEDRMEITSGGRSNPLGRARCTLQRVAYRLRDGKLQRLAWPVLDQGVGVAPRVRTLLEGVDNLEFSFLVGGDQVSSEWPPDARFSNPPDLPRAVRAIIDIEGWGRLERTFLPVSTGGGVEQ